MVDIRKVASICLPRTYIVHFSWVWLQLEVKGASLRISKNRKYSKEVYLCIG